MRGSNIFFCGSFSGSKIFAQVFFFPHGSAFCTRWDYFSILQRINWAFFSWVSSQQILTKPCLTPLVFLSGLLDICKIDEIQCVSMNVWLNSTCELQTDLILRRCEYRQILHSSQTPQSSFENSTHLWKLFHGKNFSERMLHHALNRIFRLLHSYTKISNIFCKINYDGQSRQVFS